MDDVALLPDMSWTQPFVWLAIGLGKQLAIFVKYVNENLVVFGWLLQSMPPK